MIALLLVCDAANALEALTQALSTLEPLEPGSVTIDPVPHREEGILFYRWLSLRDAGFDYSDVIHNEDGSTEPIVRSADSGYLSPDGEGRWAVFSLNASGHMLEEAAMQLLEFIDPDWGRYED